MTMDWFRYHHGTPQDPKLTMLAKKINVPRCHMTAVWDEILDHASRNVTRGHIANIDLEVIAFTQEISIENVIKIYGALQEKGVIKDGHLAAWNERQPKREDEGAAERKRLQREKEKAAKSTEKEEGILFSHDMSHTVTTDKTRPDQIRKVKKETPLPPKIGNPEFVETSEEGSFFQKDFGLGSVGWNIIDKLSPEAHAEAIDTAKSLGWSLLYLVETYNGFKNKTKDYPRNPDKAFHGWIVKFTKGKPPP